MVLQLKMPGASIEDARASIEDVGWGAELGSLGLKTVFGLLHCQSMGSPGLWFDVKFMNTKKYDKINKTQNGCHQTRGKHVICNTIRQRNLKKARSSIEGVLSSIEGPVHQLILREVGV